MNDQTGRIGDRHQEVERDHEPIPLIIYKVDQLRYGLPLETVERVLPMTAVCPLPEAPPITLGVINLRGSAIAVVDLRKRFGLPSRDYGVDGILLVARSSRRVLAFPVDEVLGVSEVAPADVSPPEALLPGIGQIAGVVRLADGVLLIQDLDTFLGLDEERQLHDALDKAPR